MEKKKRHTRIPRVRPPPRPATSNLQPIVVRPDLSDRYNYNALAKKMEGGFVMTILANRKIPFEAIFRDGTFILVDTAPEYEYVDNQKTDKVIGIKYGVVDTMNFDKITVKVRGQKKPLMPLEKLLELRESGEKVLVEFINGVDRLYIRRNGNIQTVEDSFSAENISLIKQE